MAKVIFLFTLQTLAMIQGFSQPPLLRDFMGINGHFHFDPNQYAQTCRLARNYHNLNWDVKKPGDPITFPLCVNKVNWKTHVYGKWISGGFENSLCAMFGSFGESNKDYISLWKGQEDWCFEYGKSMASYFGPSGNEKLITSIEIDNEPGNDFDDPLYQSIFRSMARGIRAGDPKIKIVTCTAHAHQADKYSKDLRETFSDPQILELFDVINVHTYAQMEKGLTKSPWTRTYPEGEDTTYLEVIEETIQWRDHHAPGKEIWITEFGYDSCTPRVMANRTGWFEKLDWRGVTDLQQAQYLIRSFLLFSSMKVDRAYLYFFDDKDEPQVHGSSGITRNGKPKPSFHAVSQLYQTLGDYRFSRIVQKNSQLYLFEFLKGKDRDQVCWVAWSPTGFRSDQKVKKNHRATEITLADLPSKPDRLLAMQTSGESEPKDFVSTSGSITFELSESPVYLFFEPKQ